MKLEAKQRLQAFELIPPGFVVPVERVKAAGDNYNNKGMLEFVHGASPDPNLTVGFRNLGWQGKDLTFYVFVSGKCQGQVTFNFNEGSELIRRSGLKPGSTLFANPHSMLDKSVQRSGIVSSLYSFAMSKGIALITDAHTEMAARLWEKLGRDSKNILLHIQAGEVLEGPTSMSFKLLMRKTLWQKIT